jgi:hypothetical protein
VKAFIDTTRSSPDDLRWLAMATAVRGGNGTLALQLAAEQRDPGEWITDYNLASYLQAEGFPRAAKVLLDSLVIPEDVRGPGDLNLYAALLHARGMIHIQLGQPQRAIPLLREARRREPMLVESTRALALALLMLGKDTEAEEELKALGVRFATWERGSDLIPPGGYPDSVAHRPPLGERWNLNKGRPGRFVPEKTPGSVDALASFRERLQASLQRMTAKEVAAVERMQAANVAFGKDTTEWPLPDQRALLQLDVSNQYYPFRRFMACGDAWSTDNPQPLVQRTYLEADSLFEEERYDDVAIARLTREAHRLHAVRCANLNAGATARHVKDLLDQIAGCPESPDEANRRCVCEARRSVATAQWSEVNREFLPFLAGVIRWFNLAHRYATSIASHTEPEDAVLRAVVASDIAVAEAQIHRWVHQEMLLAYGAIPDPCTPSEENPLGGTGEEEPDPLGVCDALDGGGLSVNAVAFDIKVTCYDVEFEFGAKVRGAFSLGASTTYAFGGKDAGALTFFVGGGVGGELGPFKAGAKAGGYVTVQKVAGGGTRPDNLVIDAGTKQSGGVSAGPISVEKGSTDRVIQIRTSSKGSTVRMGNPVAVWSN